jgi:hypothetical protein
MAKIRAGAFVAIIALHVQARERVVLDLSLLAVVFRARILVVQIRGDAHSAYAIFTMIARGAVVLVEIAGQAVGRIHAATL